MRKNFPALTFLYRSLVLCLVLTASLGLVWFECFFIIILSVLFPYASPLSIFLVFLMILHGGANMIYSTSIYLDKEADFPILYLFFCLLIIIDSRIFFSRQSFLQFRFYFFSSKFCYSVWDYAMSIFNCYTYSLFF